MAYPGATEAAGGGGEGGWGCDGLWLMVCEVRDGGWVRGGKMERKQREKKEQDEAKQYQEEKRTPRSQHAMRAGLNSSYP